MDNTSQLSDNIFSYLETKKEFLGKHAMIHLSSLFSARNINEKLEEARNKLIKEIETKIEGRAYSKELYDECILLIDRGLGAIYTPF
jgi:hypothetical protein